LWRTLLTKNNNQIAGKVSGAISSFRYEDRRRCRREAGEEIDKETPESDLFFF
jgi:hypothetical protein